MMEDHEIVALYFARSESAITETARKFGAYCRTIAWNILGSRRDAEECENDTWLAAWNSIPPNHPARLAPYLGRITRNLALDRYDQAHAQKRGGVSGVMAELDDCLPDPALVHHTVEAAETARQISAFLREQPAEARRFFLRRYWYCDKTADIARRYGVSEGKVRVTLHRTREKLKDFLQQQGVEL
ncbi:sigma-70 family RNA polymerase sigma factor [uncultured Gemmiger sp.]|uniref:RNA polymerase sigma factor n=1 Tax=uncultured Gemmiger sp. TaxID=1623490 RepID=UPI0025D1D3F2|nr:sigma-70 family RNA polymerase sigma factor [uncultured Gemmiger sp.]